MNNLNAFSGTTKIVLRIIFVCLLSTIISSDAAINTKDRIRENRIKYEEILQKISVKKGKDKINSLQHYHLKNPRNENIYLKLLNAYIEYNRIDEASDYFNSNSSRLNSLYLNEWMMAKICLLKKNEIEAREHFRISLSDNNSSLKMIHDFIQYFQDSSMVFNILNKRITSSCEKYLVLAMIKLRIRRYEDAAKYLIKIEAKFPLDPFIQQIYGDIYFNINNFRKADSIWNVGLIQSRKNKDFDTEAKLLNSLGNLECTKLNFNQAFICFKKSDSIAFLLENKQLLQLNAASRGSAYYGIDRYEDAIRYYEQAIKLAKRIMDESKLAELYKYEGWTYIQLNKYNETLSAYELSEIYARKLNNKQEILEIILSKAELYDFLDQNEIALDQLISASNVAKSYKYNKLNYEIESEIEGIKVKKGDYNTVKKQYMKFIRYLESTNRVVEQADWIKKLADIYKLEGNIKQAKKYYSKSAVLFGKANSQVYKAWSMLYLADLESLEGYFNKALKIRKEVERVAKSYNRLDLLLDLEVGYGNDYRLIGDNHRSTKAYQHAIDIIERMRGNITIDQLRMSYFSKYSNLYKKQIDNYAKLTIEYPKADIIDSIKYFIISGRERNLQDKMKERIIDSRAKHPCENMSYRNACSKLEELQHQARKNKMRMLSNDSLKYFQARIEAAKYSVLGQRLKIKESTLKNISRANNNSMKEAELFEEIWKKNAALLIIHISDPISFIIALNRQDTAIVRLNTNPRKIQQAVDSLINPFHQHGKTSVEKIQFCADMAFYLYQILIKPVENILNKSNCVIIIPDESLIDLPFEILLCEKPMKIKYSPLDSPDYSNNFLLHKYTFLYSPMFGSMSKRTFMVGHNPRMSIFANPYLAFQSNNHMVCKSRSQIFGRFDPLPFAELEAEQINCVKKHVRTFTREAATEKCFEDESRKADILHFATHAFYDSSFDAFSGIVLAETEDPKDDGLLMGYEIADSQLNCDLITLSACGSGRGKRMAGEGILGLPRTFLTAGAKTVLMTLWEVDDRFSSIIMPLFYNGYLNNRLTKAEALAEAKRAIFNTQELKPAAANNIYNTNSKRRQKNNKKYVAKESKELLSRWSETSNSTGVDYRHPFFWASFMLFGEQGAEVEWGKGVSIKTISIILGCVLVIVLWLTVRKMKQNKRIL